MKISLNQPGGFASHFAPDKNKYLNSDGNPLLIKPKSNIKRASLILM